MAGPLLDAFSSATEMVAAVGSGAISASELLDLHLDRIARHNPALNAIVTHEADDRARARARDAANGALAGLPLTVKDSIDVAGLPTTSGDPARARAVAERDAPLVGRVLGAGGVLLGKTNVPLLTGDWQTYNDLFGRTNNPWDLARTPGGSTGGAAALAAGLTALEFGSDVGGSIRLPAAFCGVFGHRPTDGAVPGAGQFPLPPVMQVLGPLARTAADVALAMGVISDRHAEPRAARLEDLRVAVLPWIEWLPVDGEVAAALEDLAGRLPRSAVAAPEAFDAWAHEELFASLLAYATYDPDPEARTRIADAIARAPEPLAPAMLRGVRAGEAEYAGMLAERERWRERWARFFTDHDILLTPVAFVPAFPHDHGPFLRRRIEVDGEPVPYKRLEVYPGLASLSGLPATAIPAGRTRSGLPIGLQAIGARFEDATCLQFALLAERELGCRFVVPPGYE